MKEEIVFDQIIKEMREIISSPSFRHDVYEHTVGNNEAGIRVRKELKYLSTLALQARKESINYSGKYYEYKGVKEPIKKTGVLITRNSNKVKTIATFKDYQHHGLLIEIKF